MSGNIRIQLLNNCGLMTILLYLKQHYPWLLSTLGDICNSRYGRYLLVNIILDLTFLQASLHDTRHNTIMLEPTCLGRDPLVCVASSVGSATQYPCVNSLLQHEPQYDDKCYITVSHTPDVANNVLKLARVKTVPG